jgi:hypothetical protein
MYEIPDFDGPPDDDFYQPSDEDFVSAPQQPKSSATPQRKSILEEIRCVIAAHQGLPYATFRELVQELTTAENVRARLDETQQRTLTGLLEIFADLTTTQDGGTVDLLYVPLAGNYSRAVREELEQIRARMPEVEDTKPALAWKALKERVQREIAETTASRYLKQLQAQDPVEDLLETYDGIAPPTTRKAGTRDAAAKTAKIIAAEDKAANGIGHKLRIASGLPSLDYALTGKGESVGFISPSQGMLIAGLTGTGKSSWTYGVMTGMLIDLRNQGEEFAKVLFAHTEEEPIDKVKGFRMLPGQPFHYLADNLLVSAVGTSRKKLMMAVYDNIADAHTRSKETGVPITKFLIRVLVLDYIQAIMEQGEEPTGASMRTAELLLRGIQFWNPEEMAKWSGISYQGYTGQSWPEGMENHRVAGIYMAQLVKQNDDALLYTSGGKSEYSDFALEADEPGPHVWDSPDGGMYEWEVKERDLRLLKQNSIRGSGQILQNADVILILHRSRPYNNPARPEPGEDGYKHLVDTRARFILDKTRHGSGAKYIPMAFDIDPEGNKARYYDALSERMMRDGQLQNIDTEVYQGYGDPLLPRRRRQTAFDTTIY